MELREMIEAATKLVENQKLIAKVIGVAPNSLTDAKAGRRGLPASACIKLAKILEIDPIAVIAASELVTEKNAEKRALFAPFVLNLHQLQIVLTGMITAALIGGTTATDAVASDTLNLSTPTTNPLYDSASATTNRGFTDYAHRDAKSSAAFPGLSGDPSYSTAPT